MTASNYPTKEELQKIFEVRIVNGCERLWRKPFTTGNNNRVVDGYYMECKAVSNGYSRIWANGRNAYYHDIIWILCNGDMPHNLMVDHLNGNRLDNRLCNLALKDTRGNQQNTTKQRNGKLVGAVFIKQSNMWISKISTSRSVTGGKNISISLGVYNTEKEAHQMYMRAFSLLDQFSGDKEEFRRLVLGDKYIEPKWYSYCKERNNWEVYMDIKQERVRFGRFETEDLAKRVVESAKRNIHLFTGDHKQFRTIVKQELTNDNL